LVIGICIKIAIDLRMYNTNRFLDFLYKQIHSCQHIVANWLRKKAQSDLPSLDR